MQTTKFKIGDEVVVIKDFKDSKDLHFATEMLNDIGNNKVRTIKKVHELNNGTIGYTLDNSWTWLEESLQFAYDITQPYCRVINKIKTLQNKRKEAGYAF